MEHVVRVPLFTDEIQPYQYKWLVSLINKQKLNITKDYGQKIDTLKQEQELYLKELNTAYAAMTRIFLNNYTQCERCQGEGTVQEYFDAHDNRGKSVKCTKCDGAGYIKKGE